MVAPWPRVAGMGEAPGVLCTLHLALPPARHWYTAGWPLINTQLARGSCQSAEESNEAGYGHRATKEPPVSNLACPKAAKLKNKNVQHFLGFQQELHAVHGV